MSPRLAPLLLLAAWAWAGEAGLARRWVYLQTNLLVEENVVRAEALAARAAAAGYNGVAVADSKFCRWGDLPERYAANVARFAAACRRNRLAVIPCVFPLGYSNDLLSRAPDLAEGVPAREVPFIVRDGRLVPEAGAGLANGGFEEAKGASPAGWSWVDQPGRICVLDREVRHGGAASLRMQDIAAADPQHGNARAVQEVAVRPWTPYHVGVLVRTRGFTAAAQVRITVLDPAGNSLSFHTPEVKPDQDWTPLDLVFNSLGNDKVRLYFGVWGGKGGTLWWDDAVLEPAGPVNVLRRAGTPVRARLPDGTALEEGRDLEQLGDPLLGRVPWPGGYTAWHEPPRPRILAGGRLAEGGRALLSWYHPMLIHEGAVPACLAAPELAPQLAWQAGEVRRHLAPDAWFMSHDEIRVAGWCADCAARRPDETLAGNVRDCVAVLAAADPGREVCVWSDMFDPQHNAAAKGPYYLARGDGPWHGSWAGLPAAVTVVNWNSDPAKRRASLAHFAGRGHRQILAGYYDGDPQAIRGWLADAAGLPGVDGVMYTTWAGRYDDLERFAAAAWGN